MSVVEDVRYYVEGLEKAAEESGWDQPAVLHRLYFDWNSGALTSTVMPLQFLHPHPPTAVEWIAHGLETGQFPLSTWPKVGEIALLIMHEAWMADPTTGTPGFVEEYQALHETLDNDEIIDGKFDAGDYQRRLHGIYDKYYGQGWQFELIPGSKEVRQVAGLMGKKTMMYERVRGEEPRWRGDEDGDGWQSFGRLHAAMVAIQRHSRLNG